jgi:Protein of unknown function (DUF2568)
MQSHDSTAHARSAARRPLAGVQTSGIQAAAFASELAMLALLAVIGVRLGTATLALELVLAVLLPLSAAATWSVWMAPRSSRRLADPVRFCAQAMLFAVTGVLAAVAGMTSLGIAFGVTATAVFALTRATRDIEAL